MTRAAAVAALLLLAVAGCDSAPRAATAPLPTARPTAPPTAPPTASLVLTAAPLARPTVLEDFTDFASPSGNIGCHVADGTARCDIAERSWQAPPKPAGCELDWGQGVGLGEGPPSFLCAGDTALGAQRVLAYGQSVVSGNLRCTSERTGVRCENTRTGHGFALSRQGYRLR